MRKKLYLIHRHGRAGLDEAYGFVVCERSPQRARKAIVTTESNGDEGPERWISDEYSLCKCIGLASNSVAFGIVLRDFKAG